MQEFDLVAYVNNTFNPERQDLIDILNENEQNKPEFRIKRQISNVTTSDDSNNYLKQAVNPSDSVNDNNFKKSKSIILKQILPLFLKVTSKSAMPVQQLINPLIPSK